MASLEASARADEPLSDERGAFAVSKPQNSVYRELTLSSYWAARYTMHVYGMQDDL
jgi:hypothetical protein